MSIGTTFKSYKSRLDLNLLDNVWFVPYAVKILRVGRSMNARLYSNITSSYKDYCFAQFSIDYFSNRVLDLILEICKENKQLEQIKNDHSKTSKYNNL